MNYDFGWCSGNEKDQAFRSMVLEVCKRLDPSCLEAMKYQCRDYIGRGKLEKIDTFFDLFTVLEQRDIVSSDDVEFLITCLNVVFRKDLIKLVKVYADTWLISSHRSFRTWSSSSDVNSKNMEANMSSTKCVSSAIHQFPDKLDNKAQPFSSDGFSHPINGPASNLSPFHSVLIRFISDSLSFNWQTTVRYLGVPDEIISASQLNWPNDMRRQIYESMAEFAR